MKKMYFTVMLAVLAVVNVNAQDHKHGSPHGGAVKSAGDFHIEVSAKNGMLMAYLLDANEKAMANTGVTGTALIQTAEGQASTVTLIPSGKDGFMYTLDKSKKYNKAIVTFTSSGKTASASFDLAKKEAKDEHSDHQH